MVATASESTLGSSNNGKGEESNRPGGENSISHPQAFEERHEDEDLVMPDAGPTTEVYCTESRTTRKTLSSSLEERLADKMRWGHLDPRTEWYEWQEVVCNEDIDAVLAARRARNRQLGK
jgi:hypothetical protein